MAEEDVEIFRIKFCIKASGHLPENKRSQENIRSISDDRIFIVVITTFSRSKNDCKHKTCHPSAQMDNPWKIHKTDKHFHSDIRSLIILELFEDSSILFM